MSQLPTCRLTAEPLVAVKGRDPRPTKSDPDGLDFIYIMKVPVAYAQAARLVYACSYDLLDVLIGDL